MNSTLNAAWRVRGLTATQKIVLVRLADRADEHGHCYPGQTGIAADCCLTTRSVRDALAELVAAGHLSVSTPATFSTPARYRVHPKAPPPEAGSGGEACSGGEAGSGPSGTTFRSPPEAGSGPLRNHVPPNHHITIKEPSDNHQGVGATSPANMLHPETAEGVGEVVSGFGTAKKPEPGNLELKLPSTDPDEQSAALTLDGKQNATRAPKAQQRRTVLDPIEIPEPLRTPAFSAKWAEWQTHRRAYKGPKDWVFMFREQLEWLAGFPAPVATEILASSIRNGWQGLFEPKTKPNGGRPSVADQRNRFIGKLGCEGDEHDVPFV